MAVARFYGRGGGGVGCVLPPALAFASGAYWSRGHQKAVPEPRWSRRQSLKRILQTGGRAALDCPPLLTLWFSRFTAADEGSPVLGL